MAKTKAEPAAAPETGIVPAATPPTVSVVQPPGEALEKLIARGDLSALSVEERTQYYVAVCNSLGLNPLTQPFEYTTLSGKLRLYARRECSEQLRRLYNVTVEIVSQTVMDDCLVVHVRAHMPTAQGQRRDEDLGVVSLAGLRGESRANAIMKAITKAKRRVTLSICGLGFLDETEVTPADPAPVVTASPPPAPPRPSTNGPAPISPDSSSYQIGRIRELAGALGYTEEQISSSCRNKYGVASLDDLTSAQAGEVIVLLEGKLNARNSQPAA